MTVYTTAGLELQRALRQSDAMREMKRKLQRSYWLGIAYGLWIGFWLGWLIKR